MTDSANSSSAVSIRTNDTDTEYLVELFIVRNNEKTSSSCTVLGQIASTSELFVAKLIGHTAVYQYFLRIYALRKLAIVSAPLQTITAISKMLSHDPGLPI